MMQINNPLIPTNVPHNRQRGAIAPFVNGANITTSDAGSNHARPRFTSAYTTPQQAEKINIYTKAVEAYANQQQAEQRENTQKLMGVDTYV